MDLSIQFGTRKEIGEQRYQEQAALRHQVFCQRLKWEIPGVSMEDKIEEDGYDHEDTIYVLCGKPLVACCRIIPSCKKHMVSELWPSLLQNGLSETTWELSRMATSKEYSKVSGLACAALFEAIIDYAKSRSIKKYLFVTTSIAERLVKMLGISYCKLGTLSIGGGSIFAALFDANSSNHEIMQKCLQERYTKFNEQALATA